MLYQVRGNEWRKIAADGDQVGVSHGNLEITKILVPLKHPLSLRVHFIICLGVPDERNDFVAKKLRGDSGFRINGELAQIELHILYLS